MQSSPKILIVEDDEVTASLYQRLLESHGYEVKVAPDGEFAQASLAFEKPDLVLLDLMLPKVPGVEVLHFIKSREESRQVPTIVFSNNLQSSTGEAARMKGGGAGTEYLSKMDCSPERLLQVISGALARRKLLADEPAMTGSLERPATRPASTPALEPGNFAPSPPTQPAAGPGADSSPPPTTPLPAVSAPAAVGQTAPDAPARKGSLDRNAIDTIRTELRQTFLQNAPPKVAGLNAQLLEMSKSKTPDWPGFLLSFEVSLNAAMVNAGFAGLNRIARFAGALQGLVKDLREEPATINASSIRTLIIAVDFLRLLLHDAMQTLEEEMWSEPLVLVVDDELVCRSSACLALGTARMKTISLEDPILALRVLTENLFDLVVTDVNMPGTDGYELCKQLRLMRKHNKTPVIFLTGLSDFQSRARSALSGANEYIVKPFSPAELIVKSLILIMKPPAKGS